MSGKRIEARSQLYSKPGDKEKRYGKRRGNERGIQQGLKEVAKRLLEQGNSISEAAHLPAWQRKRLQSYNVFCRVKRMFKILCQKSKSAIIAKKGGLTNEGERDYI